MYTKFERLLSKSLTTLEVMTYHLVVHTGPRHIIYCDWVRWKVGSAISILVWQHVKLSEQIRPSIY